MPRRGENIYKRKDGRWEGRVLKSPGRYQYVYARTYKEVKEKKKLLQEGITKELPSNTHSRCDAAKEFTAWLHGDLTGRVKPSTYESYYRCIVGYVIPFYQEKGNEQISLQTTSDFSCRINNHEGVSVSYRRKILTIYKTALREIMKRNKECDSILNAIQMPRKISAEVQAFSVKEQRMLERTIIQSPDKRCLGILLCFYTGIRLGEVCGLKWEDIDFEAGTMVVTRTVSRIKNFDETKKKTVLYIGKPKSIHSVRKIPLPDFLLELARELKMERSDNNHFILTNSEYPMDPRKYQKLFQKLLTHASVKKRKFHAIRHTFATRALELGIDIKTLSEILGHSNVSITLNIYAHSMYEQKKKAIGKLNAMYVMHTETPLLTVKDSVTVA
ncbi:tyrosine-type recombinase/integrase [Lacrimispora saccharolytica]|uniref:Integrase family protein n=1 Tax=Lacrimispora saccharolytica (strain ATCC 35040 / DSM 2544 / NRCC 2533 / WM1) TaxID=610130 RepID=D9R1W3_LACSW|nr:site-specific integrase [Lacrimispora saccharolytica]ADL02854.1 integrase family protein [[Clostridium] saccharolyticum WM1]QRV18943.1 site-specific integrase [Lacrimispora saccharolytica]